MHAYKCDKCGVLYESSNDKINVKIFHVERLVHLCLKITFMPIQEHNNTDLCDDCIGEILYKVYYDNNRTFRRLVNNKED